MQRIFVGLRPPKAMRDQLLMMMGGVPGARWQSDEQLHVTLKFIGEVDRHAVRDVAAALAGIRAPAPEAQLDGVGRFGEPSRPHTLYAGLAPPDALTALHKKVEQACARFGLTPEKRRFHPHITLARLNRAAAPVDGFLAVHAGLASPPAHFQHLLLYESTLGHGGSSYTVIERFALD